MSVSFSNDEVLLQPMFTPNMIGIAQKEERLWAFTKCCKSKIFWKIGKEPIEVAYCSKCGSGVEQTNHSLNSACVIAQESSASIAGWVSAWTGVDIQDLLVVIE